MHRASLQTGKHFRRQHDNIGAEGTTDGAEIQRKLNLCQRKSPRAQSQQQQPKKACGIAPGPSRSVNPVSNQKEGAHKLCDQDVQFRSFEFCTYRFSKRSKCRHVTGNPTCFVQYGGWGSGFQQRQMTVLCQNSTTYSC